MQAESCTGIAPLRKIALKERARAEEIPLEGFLRLAALLANR